MVSNAISDLVRRDHGIRGLATLLDPTRLLTELRASLDTGQVERIELNYLRYKPGMNCLARYDLLIGGKHVTAYAKAHGSDATAKISKSVERPVTDSAIGPGRVVLGDHQIIFSIFPNDSKLASLQSLLDPESRDRLLDRIFGSDHNWGGCTAGKALNYKPERRYVTRFLRSDGESSLVKFYSSGGYARARTISRKLTSQRGNFYPDTFGRSKKHRVVAYHWRPGKTLRQLTEDGSLSGPDLEATAGALAEFHASGKGGLSLPDPDAMGWRLEAVADQLGILLPDLEYASASLARRLADWARTNTSMTTSIHGDFYDKQAVVKDGKVSLIDLDAACLGDPVADLGSYIAHLERAAINHLVAARDVETQRETLIGAYEKLRGSVGRRHLDCHVALSLFTLIHHPFRDWAPDWPQQTRRLLERVQSLCAG